MLSKDQLIETCSNICYYAQNHSQDWDRVKLANDLNFAMEHTSFVIACFIAQNTKGGTDGVDWDVVHHFLSGPVLTYQQWEEVITKVVNLYENY